MALPLESSKAQSIPIEHLDMDLAPNQPLARKMLLENEIDGITLEHIALAGNSTFNEGIEDGYKNIYLFIKGNGILLADGKGYELIPESIFLPNALREMSIKVGQNEGLHFLKVTSKLTEQDFLDLAEFPRKNTANPYFMKFSDCEAYTEPIKSPNTVSRTVLPNKIIPRIALGTVETTGPDKVGAHEHPMLEQTFLGLSENNVIVYADEAKTDFPAYSLLHIPLGSSHSVEVKSGNKMYYMWMDFFIDSAGEEWLKTHNHIKDK